MPAAADRSGAWYRQPVLWLGAFVFLASMAGCIWLIVVGARHTDEAVEAPHAVFGVPVAAHSSAASAPHERKP